MYILSTSTKNNTFPDKCSFSFKEITSHVRKSYSLLRCNLVRSHAVGEHQDVSSSGQDSVRQHAKPRRLHFTNFLVHTRFYLAYTQPEPSECVGYQKICEENRGVQHTVDSTNTVFHKFRKLGTDRFLPQIHLHHFVHETGGIYLLKQRLCQI